MTRTFSVADHGSSTNFMEAAEEEFVPDYKQKRGVSPRLIIGVVAGVCLLALALGLGLGLGLKGSNESSACPKFPLDRSWLSSTPRSTGSRWLQQQCTITPDQECPKREGTPPLIVISLDGFRAEYLTRNLTPVLSKLAECGSYTPAMRPVFPSKTFPNHYAIVTGLYPESHGIIENFMYDKSMKKIFTLAGEEKNDPRWWHGEPIWNTAKKHGRRAATMFWPGSEAPIQGMRPDFCYEFYDSLPFEYRVNQVLQWLDLPSEERPDLITLYINQPDAAGHKYGPYHALLNSNLTDVDGYIGQLMDGLLDRGLDKCTNVIVLADHGMAPLDCPGRLVTVDKAIDNSKLFFYGGVVARVTGDYRMGSNGQIIEQEDGATPEEIVESLKCGSFNNTQDWYSRAQRKQDLPVRLHYQKSPRIEDVIVTMEEEWSISASDSSHCPKGNHGYDNKFDSMQALFLAYGPSIKENTLVEPFENIEVYNLLTELLGIEEGAPNNGTKGSLSDLLREPSKLTGPSPGASYGSCPYPDNPQTVASRRNSSTCRCHGTPDPDELDERLDLSDDDISRILGLHLPLGVPSIQAEGDLCQLAQQDYVTGYDKDRLMPAWSAFHLSETSAPPEDLEDSCVRRDVRLADDHASDCADFQDDITWGFLFPSKLSGPDEAAFDAHISSNLVPMYKGFKEGIWQYVIELLEEYREKYGSIYVTAGPVFDLNNDGLADDLPSTSTSSRLEVPNYYYVTLLRCDSGNLTHCSTRLQTMSVLVPHKPSLDKCQTYEISGYFNYLRENVARVRDIEHLRGITFYTGLPEEQRAKVITHLEIGLWERKSWMDQEDCPNLSSPTCPPGYDSNHPPVLLISLDGFRHDYIERNLTKTLERMSTCGVSTPFMRPVYPSLTFPNHYSLVTGLYPDFNGIIDNSMYDLSLGMPFYLSSPNAANSSWWGGEPIWNTVEKQGKKAVIMFWPGSDVAIQGMRPSDYYMYDGDVPYSFRVDQILKWLNGSAGGVPDLLVLYMSKVDKQGHEGGPVSVQVNEALTFVDRQISDLMDGIQRAGLSSCINILVTSDHGMTDISCDRSVLLKDYLDNNEMSNKMYAYPGGAGRIATKYTRKGNDYHHIPEGEQVVPEDIVHDLECQSENMAVYLNKDFPVRFHYASNPRTDQVQLKMRDTWQVDRYSPYCPILGQHGWDPSFDNMKAFFLAYGPAFKDKYRRESFETIELYNLIAELLGLEHAPNNGTEGSLYDILRKEPALPPVVPSKNYTECLFPTDSDEYYRRSNDTDCDCSLTPENIKAADDRLNLSPDEQQNLKDKHYPQGEPFLVSHIEGNPVNQTVCILTQEDYITGFSHELNIPLWSSFTLADDQVDKNIQVPNCLRPDVRLDPEYLLRCKDLEAIQQDYVYQHLFPPQLASSNTTVSDAGLLSNIVPMHKGFVTAVWTNVINQMREWTKTYKNVHYHVGPAFDYNSDGVADSVAAINQTNENSPLVIPSHFYLTMLWCDEPCDKMEYSVNSFIIPHRANISNCMNFEEYLNDNRARLRDIELITNLQMVTSENTIETVKVRTSFTEDLSSLS